MQILRHGLYIMLSAICVCAPIDSGGIALDSTDGTSVGSVAPLVEMSAQSNKSVDEASAQVSASKNVIVVHNAHD